MIILVTGLLKYDAGKTTWTIELLELMKEYNVNVIPFKPVGGHNAWYQYVTIRYSLELNALVGEDAYKLARTVDRIDLIEVLSPVDVLLAPLDPEYYQGDYRRYVDDSEVLEKQAVLARITVPYGDSFITTHYLIKDNYSKIIGSLKDDIDVLASRLKNLERISSNAFTKILESDILAKNLALIQDRLEHKYDVLVIESFNNVALPIPSAIKADYVFAVAPGKVLLYSGEDYRKALAVYGTVPGMLAYETAPVISLLKKPLLILDWEPKVYEKQADVKPSEAAEKALSFILEKT